MGCGDIGESPLPLATRHETGGDEAQTDQIATANRTQSKGSVLDIGQSNKRRFGQETKKMVEGIGAYPSRLLRKTCRGLSNVQT